MPPLFVNPHFLPESSVIISRNEIYAENEDVDGRKKDDIDLQLLNNLKELISAAWDLSPDLRQEGRSKKRSKSDSLDSTQDGEGIAFRLLSGLQSPRPILLRPKTPPPVCITREPETEDNEVQAALRAECAKATAVDGSRILLESLRPMPRYGDSRKLKLARTISPMSSLPDMMIVESRQPPRPTRPPIPTSQLQRYPYNNGPVVLSTLQTTTSNCPIIELAPIPSKTSTSLKRRRRRKPQRDRLMPAFWRPNPRAGGKCLGYAMGFPCSVEVLKSGNDSFTRYPQDTMRTMTY